MKTCSLRTRHCGDMALVVYVPDPLASFLHSLGPVLRGRENPRAHITILPPRPLTVPVETASDHARTVLRNFWDFEVKLSDVGSFSETNVIYIDISSGNGQLHDLHDALNTGELRHAERFEFRPHLTLGVPVSAHHLESAREQAQQAWQASNCSPRVAIQEVVCLWLRPGGSQSDWSPLWSHRLAGAAITQRAAKIAGVTQTS
jgi:2'-5' RNA ligase